MYLTQRIGNTTYRVKVTVNESGTQTLEDMLLRLIRNDTLANGGECGIIHVLPDPVTGLYPIDGYCCSTYELTKYRSDKTCSSHSITSKAIRLLLLNTIREVVRYATFDEERFIRRVREQSEIQNKADAKELQRKIGKSQKRIAELDRLIMKLYEDYALDRIG